MKPLRFRLLFFAWIVACGSLFASSASATPDLTCSIEAEPNALTGTVTLTITVENIGDTDAVPTPDSQSFWLLGYVHLPSAPDNDTPDKADFALQTVGAGQSVQYEWVVDSDPGSYQSWCLVNPPDPNFPSPVADETNKENNQGSASWVLNPKPPPAADVIITAVEAELTGENEYTFTATVKNLGNSVAEAHSVELYVDFETEPDYATTDSNLFCNVPELSPDEEQTVSCSDVWTGYGLEDVGQKTIWAFADRFGEIQDEFDTSNNSFETTIAVVGPPDLTVTDISVASDSDEVTYTVTIDNLGGTDATEVQVCLYYDADAQPAIGTVPNASQTVSTLAPDSAQALNFPRTGASGGNFTVWVVIDCQNQISESDEANNGFSKDYEVTAPPNEPPVFNGAPTGPTVCYETEACSWQVTAADATATPINYRVVDAPIGMWTDETGAIHYVPPLGSTTGPMTVTVEVFDTEGLTDTTDFTFAIHPSETFAGVVGGLGVMPKQTERCPMVELPGQGFAYVDRTQGRVRIYADPTDESTVTSQANLKELDGNPNALYSCIVRSLPGGGIAVFELNSHKVIKIRGDGQGPASFVTLPGSASVIYGERFDHVAGNTFVFNSSEGVEGTLVFMNLATGQLDASWGGNSGAIAGNGTPGKFDLYHRDGAGFELGPDFMRIDGDTITIYNEFNGRYELMVIDRNGIVQDEIPLSGFLPLGGPTSADDPDVWSAPDGGFLVLHRNSATLRWYRADGSPLDSFVLAEAGTDPEPGQVAVAALGLSMTNLRCEALQAGGFTCHDAAEQRGYVIDAFAKFWDNCASLDVSPSGLLSFGGVAPGNTKTRNLLISNDGGGFLVIDSIQIVGTATTFSHGSLPTTPTIIGPNETLSVPVTYSPTSVGSSSATLRINSNACSPIALTMVGFSGPRVEVVPAEVSFDGVPAGPHTRTLRVRSVGSSPVQVSVAALPNQQTPVFTMDPPSVATTTLQPGSEVELTLGFDGDMEGEFATEVTVTTNNSNGQSTIKVPVTARTGPRLQVVPAGLNFGPTQVGGTTTRTVTISNNGFSPITFQAPTLAGPAGFSTSVGGFATTLEPNQSTSFSVSWSAAARGTALSIVTIEHDAEGVPPVQIYGIAGAGTLLPEGFDGVLPIGPQLEGPFDEPIGASGAAIELRTGGYAVYGMTSGAIHVVTGDGTADGWFGIQGVLQVTGPNGAFPDATGLGSTLVELLDGGFAMLSASEGRIYCVRPDGKPHRYLGDNGIIDVFDAFPLATTLAPQLAQNTSTGVFAVIETTLDQVLALDRDGTPASVGSGTGVIPFSGPTSVTDSNATGIGVNLTTATGGFFVLADSTTERIYRLAADGSLAGLGSQPGQLETYEGPMTSCGQVRTLLYAPVTGNISGHQPNSQDLDLTFGDDGIIHFPTAWPGVGFGAAVVCSNSGLHIGVTDPVNDAIHFVAPDGQPLELNPRFDAPDLPAEINFGTVPVGSVSSATPLTINNPGTFPLVVKAVFGNGQFHLAAVNGTIPTQVTIPAGGSGTLNIVFEPHYADQHGTTLTITSSDPEQGAPPVIALLGSTGGDLQVAPSTGLIDFGTVPSGQTVVRKISLSNVGADPVTVSAPVFSSSPEGAFGPGDITLSAGPIAADGVGKVLDVEFTPPGPGAYFGAVTIEHDDTTRPPITVALVGRSGARLLANPSPVACAGLTPGVDEVCGLVRLSNLGTEPLHIYATSVTGDAFSVASTVATIVPGGVPVEVPVIARTPSVGTFEGTLRIVHDAPGSGGLTVVPLSAESGTTLGLSPSALDFDAIPVGSAISRPIDVVSLGGGTGNVLAATAVGSSVFSVVSLPQTPAAVSAGQPVSLSVRCAPTSAGEFTGTLVVATDVSEVPVLTAPLTCRAGGVLSVTPEVLDFGAVVGNETKLLPLTLKNVGASPLQLTGLTSSVADFVVPDIKAPELAPGETLQVAVQFKPTTAKTYEGELTVTGPDGTLGTAAVRGVSGAAFSLVSANDPVDFGIVGIGGESRRTVLLVNEGSTALQAAGPTFDGAPAFSTDVNFNELPALAPGGVLPIEITFVPASLGTYEGTMTINAVGGVSRTVSLLGRAGGVIEVRPQDIAFGELATGQTATRNVTIRNVSPNVAATVYMVQSGDTAEFQVTGFTDGTVLQPLGSRTISVTYQPTGAGQFDSTLTFYSSDDVGDGAVDVTLSGRSGAAAALLDPRSGFIGFRDVAVGQSRSRAIRIAALGKSPLAILGYSFADSDVPLSLTGLEAPPALIPGGSAATLQLVCAPKAAGVYETTLTIATSDPAQPTLAIDVWCSTPARASVTPSELAFGALSAGNTRIEFATVNNSGASAFTVTSTQVVNTAGQAFTLATEASGTLVAPGGTLDVGVSFAPLSNGSFTGNLLIGTTDPTRPFLEVPLSGFAGPRLDVSPRVANFCQAAGQRNITLTNVGTDPLEISEGSFVFPLVAAVSAVLVRDDEFLEYPVVLGVGEAITLRLAFNGVLPGAVPVDGGDFSVTSTDPDHPEQYIRVVMGQGTTFPNGFVGTMDVGPPGSPVFDATNLGAAADELCTGGFVVGSGQMLYHGVPKADGEAGALGMFGQAGGITDLAPVAAAAGLDLDGVAADFGALVRTIGSTGMTAVASPSAGIFVLVAANGELATWHASGGRIDVRAVAGGNPVIGDILPITGGFLVSDRQGRRLIAMTEAGALKTDVGNQGIIDLTPFRVVVDNEVVVPVTNSVGDSLVTFGTNLVGVSDPQTGRVYVARLSTGAPEITWGSSDGRVDFGGELDGGFTEPVLAMGAIGRLSGGMTVVDLARGRILYAAQTGAPNTSFGQDGVVQVTGVGGTHPDSASLARGAYIVSDVSAASALETGTFILIEPSLGDLLAVTRAGTVMATGLANFDVTPCPIVIDGASLSPGGVGGSGPILLGNLTPGVFLQLSSVELPSDLALSCVSDDPNLCGDGAVGLTIDNGQAAQLEIVWDVQQMAGCFERQVVFNHQQNDGSPSANGPQTVCPLLLQTEAQARVVPGGVDFQNEYVFPPVAVGAAVEREFIIQNTGCADMEVVSVTFQTNTPHFTEPVSTGAELPQTLGAGDLYRFKIACQPEANGNHEVQVQFNVNGAQLLPITLKCSAGPLLEFNLSTLNWFGLSPGQQQVRELKVTNLGGTAAHVTLNDGAPVTIDTAVATPGTIPDGQTADALDSVFTLVDGAFDATIGVGESRTLRVAFAPPWSAEFTSTLRMQSDSYGGEAQVNLVGRAAACPVFVPEPVDFFDEHGVISVGASETISVTVVNEGADTLFMDSIPSSLDGTVFSMEPVSLSLPVGGETSFDITCTPDMVGRFEVGLQFDASGACNAVDDIVTLPLVCQAGSCTTLTGATDGNLDIDLGDVLWDVEPIEQTFDLVNSSESDLEVTLTSDNAQLQVSGELTRTIAANSTETVTVRFVPSQAEREVTAIVVVSGGEACPFDQTVTVSANVKAPEMPTPDGDMMGDGGDTGGAAGGDTMDSDAGPDVGGDAGGTGTGGETGGDTGTDCGCDTTPGSTRNIPLGSLVGLFFALLLLGRLRTRREPGT